MVLVMIVACRGDEAKAPVEATARGSGTIRLAPEVVASARIKVEPARSDRLTGSIEVVGEISADPDRIANIASPVAGRLEDVKLEVGATVKKGDRVATVLAPELGRARADSVAKRVQATAARTEADRETSLHAKGIASDRDRIAATSHAEATEADAQAADSLLRALGAAGNVEISNSGLILRAPRGGQVIARNAVVGQPVTASEVLGTIADLGEVWFMARVFEHDLARVHVGTKTEVRFNAYPERPYTGTITYLAQQVDPAARTVAARIVLDNRDASLRLGMFGTARIAGAEATPTSIVVPRAAVVELDGKSVVFVRAKDGAFERREVVVGTSAGDRVAIASGVHEGDPVVVDGAFTLRSILLRSSFEAD